MPARPSLNMVWSSASSTLISPLVVAFVFRSSSNTTRSVPLVLLERHCTVYTIWGQDLRLFDIVRYIPTTVRPASLSGIHPSAWKVNSAKSRCSILHSPSPLRHQQPGAPHEYEWATTRCWGCA